MVEFALRVLIAWAVLAVGVGAAYVLVFGKWRRG